LKPHCCKEKDIKKQAFVSTLEEILVSGNDAYRNEFCYKNKRGVIPYRLYRYTPIGDNSVDNLISSRLCLNNPRSFNDPFDCWYRKRIKPCFSARSIAILQSRLFSLFGVNMTEDEFKADDSLQKMADKLPVDKRNGFLAIVEQSVNQVANHTSNYMNRFLDEHVRVVCLTEYSPAQLLMWSHYGDYHKGMCLEYDFLDCDEDTYAMLMPVIYTEEIPSINHDAIDNDSHCESYALKLVLFKSKEWEYEKEWRLIKCFDNPSRKKIFHHVPFLKHIYIGVCADEHDEYVKNVINFARGKCIPISKMQRKDDSYLLYKKSI